MKDDARLLHAYAKNGSEDAFAELVRRHLDLVYGAALRRTGNDSHRAREVAQQVFTSLARNARKLAGHQALHAWLHAATRNAALNLMISEARRRQRETEALSLATNVADPRASLHWGLLRPVLDAAIDDLPEADRHIVILRFLEHRSFGEVGGILRLSEDAARMRVNRALEKLRIALARHGVTSTASALAAVVSSQPLMAAPAGLATTIATQALAAAGSAGLAAAALSFMSLKLIATAAFSGLVAFGLTTYFHRDPAPRSAPSKINDLPSSTPLASLQQENQRLTSEIARLSQELADAKTASVEPAVPRAPAPQKSPSIGLTLPALQRAVLNNLRQIDAAREQYRLENGRDPGSIYDLVGENGYIRTLLSVGGEDYAQLSMRNGDLLTVITPEGIRITYDRSGKQTTQIQKTPGELHVEAMTARMHPALSKALAAYRAANNGKSPTNPQDILPFFALPSEGADFVELLEAQKAVRR